MNTVRDGVSVLPCVNVFDCLVEVCGGTIHPLLS